ncbi:hypothetical protein L1857_34595 [Amycolatopsis thermalba]|uniref:Transcription regulator PadR N-terminal domain-containing protein n=1 Tax=Amycolatopsis thermalba TaxID=944492 RepID=A0ABY4P5F8_9PSEU|nr:MULTISPECIES: hypothetical protein [Amycolatopsis]UQS27564.1 hypothetical protein L1857_34595 [Amycolatopsis thermalba]
MDEAAAVLNAWSDALSAASAVLRQHALALSPAVEARALSAVDRARIMNPQLGPRQAEIITLLDELYPKGADTGYLHRKMNYDQPNVYLTLKGLIQQGIVEKDATTRPHLYRLTDDFMKPDDQS